MDFNSNEVERNSKYDDFTDFTSNVLRMCFYIIKISSNHSKLPENHSHNFVGVDEIYNYFKNMTTTIDMSSFTKEYISELLEYLKGYPCFTKQITETGEYKFAVTIR